MAAEDSELSAIASANYALASFEAGDSSGAIRSARQLLRRRVHACVRVPVKVVAIMCQVPCYGAGHCPSCTEIHAPKKC